MQFEDQNAAHRQMKELLKDQAKFRAKLDRVVRKIETSSERTAKLAERNKTRGKATGAKKRPVDDGESGAAQESESLKVHGDKIHTEEDDHDSAGSPAGQNEPDHKDVAELQPH